MTWSAPIFLIDGSPEIDILVSGANGSITIPATNNSLEVFLTEELGSIQTIEVVYSFPDAGVTINSNALNFEYFPTAIFPKAFTPNEDGLNDRLRVFGLSNTNVELGIYNRSGELIYYTTDLNNQWDGTFKNEPVPTGTYFYDLTFFSNEEKQIRQKGTFVLLR